MKTPQEAKTNDSLPAMAQNNQQSLAETRLNSWVKKKEVSFSNTLHALSHQRTWPFHRCMGTDMQITWIYALPTSLPFSPQFPHIQ